jgi:hypothetical protein
MWRCIHVPAGAHGTAMMMLHVGRSLLYSISSRAEQGADSMLVEVVLGWWDRGAVAASPGLNGTGMGHGHGHGHGHGIFIVATHPEGT